MASRMTIPSLQVTADGLSNRSSMDVPLPVFFTQTVKVAALVKVHPNIHCCSILGNTRYLNLISFIWHFRVDDAPKTPENKSSHKIFLTFERD